MQHSRETRWLASELKFLVAPDCAAGLKQWARLHLEPDPFASAEMGDAYLTTSIYFETPQFDVFRENGSYGNAKYRVRRYGRTDEVFLERKLKNHKMVVKRRSMVNIDELRNLENANADPQWDGYWFHRRIAARRVTPVCQISYQRTARMGTSDAGPIRFTIDEDLRAIPARIAGFDHTQTGVKLLKDTVIVEMKFRDAMPDLFEGAIGEFSLRAETVSKYKLAARQLGLVETAIQAVA